MEESSEIISLDNFVIKDKAYKEEIKKRRIKISLIIISIIIVIISIAIIVYKILTNDYGKIVCIYRTVKDDETIKLINIYNNDTKFYYI